MVFYKMDFTLTYPQEERPTQEFCCRMCEKSEELFHKVQGQGLVFGAELCHSEGTFAAVAQTHELALELFTLYAAEMPQEIASSQVREITFGAFDSLMDLATCYSFIPRNEWVLEKFDLMALAGDRHFYYGEAMVQERQTPEASRRVAEDHLFLHTLLPELERIRQGSATKAAGHPVHYLLACDQAAPRRALYKTLLAELYQAGRLKNRRYAYVNYGVRSRLPAAPFEALYKANEGGVVVIRYTDADEKESEFASRGATVIAALCEIAAQYKHKVLTVFCFPPTAQKVKENFLSHWENTAFVELREDVARNETALRYLKNRASAHKMRVDKQLTGAVEPDYGYTAAELNRLYDRWHAQKLRQKLYPQYRGFASAQATVATTEARGIASEKLSGLIGLDTAKGVMKQALDYYKAQRLFADRGLTTHRPSMHMVFTGNPGTAKTTVARLFAQVMKENGLLLNGELHEVGRADLVGRFVGSTAPQVQEAFRRAKGGVLFIDEAYSLVDDRDGLFGDEAINTIVQEMENHRSDTVVIFAGYPDKMEKFLDKNPGLRSRIAFHIPFEDYSAQELSAIAAHIAQEKRLTLSEGAKEKLTAAFEVARRRPDFGNGRYARNLIEKAMMAQASRLMKMDLDTLSDRDLTTLLAEDIELPQEPAESNVIPLGFSA